MGIVYFPKGAGFDDTYQSVIQRKFDALMNTNEKKIIIVGGSSAAFGINHELLERETGYKVVNLALHAGFGNSVPTELSKANINAGDIVLLSYEWGWHVENYFTRMDAKLVMSGIDNRIEMYRYLSFNHNMRALGYLFEFANVKRESLTEAKEPIESVYSSASFDEKGNMTYPRSDRTLKYEGNEDHYGKVSVGGGEISEESAEYLKEYHGFVKNKKASVYFLSCPYYKGAQVCSDEELLRLKQQETEKIGIPYISDPVRHGLPNEYMYDTIYHCNEKGEIYNTQLIIEELKNAGAL